MNAIAASAGSAGRRHACSSSGARSRFAFGWLGTIAKCGTHAKCRERSTSQGRGGCGWDLSFSNRQVIDNYMYLTHPSCELCCGLNLTSREITTAVNKENVIRVRASVIQKL